MTGLVQDYFSRFRQFSHNIKCYLIFNTLYRISLTVYALYFPRYLIALGYNESHLARMSATATFCTAALGLFAGILSDRIGRRRSFLYGVTISKLVFFLRGFAVAMPAFYLSYAVNGAFGVLFITATAPFIYENTSREERMHAFSFRSITMRAAGIIGNLVGGYLPGFIRWVAPHLSDIVIYRIVFAIALACTVYGIRKLYQIEEKNEGHRAEAGPDARPLRIDIPPTTMKFLAKYISCEALLGFGAAHVMPFITMYMINQYQASEAAVGWIRSAAMLVSMIGVAATPVLVERMGLVRSIITTRILAVPMLLVLAYAPNLWVVAAAYALRNTFQQMSGPTKRNFMMANLDARTRATANGLMQTVRSGVRAVGMLTAGYLITTYGYKWTFWIAFAAYGISAALFHIFFVRDNLAEARYEAAS